MMQWLRRNTKQIMVVVVLLAMFSFVGAQGLYALLAPNPLNDVEFKAFDRDYTLGEFREAQMASGILEAIGFNWRPTNDREFTARHWFLLIEEARRAGLQPSSATIDEMLNLADEQWAEAGGRAAWKDRVDQPLAVVRNAMALKSLESQNAGRIFGAAMPSEPEVRKYVRDTQEKVTVMTAIFDAANWVDPEETFSEEAMQAQFENYRDVFADESDDGFGYKYPRRVTIQYVIADPVTIAGGIEIPQEAAIDYWKRNKSKYQKSVPIDDPADQLGPIEQPQQPKTRMETLKFSEARGDVYKDMKNEKAKGLARRALDELSAQLANVWSAQPIDKETGYRPIPGAVTAPDYLEEATKRVEKKHSITLRYGALELVSAEKLAQNPSLGQASLPGEAGAPINISELAFRVPNFYVPAENDETSVRLQLYQTPNSPLTVLTADPKGGWEFKDGRISQKMIEGRFVTFRVIDAREETAPDSLDDVRDQVLADLRLQSAYERMADVANEFAAAAQQIGAERALTLFDDLRTERGIQTIDSPPAFARRTPQQVTLDQLEAGEPTLLPASVTKIGRSEKFVDACFAMTTDGWSSEPINIDTERVAKAADEAATAKAAAAEDVPTPKVQLVNLPKLKKRVVVDLQNHQPVDIVAYETNYRSSAFRTLAGQRQAVARSQWYDPDNIAARCKFVDRQPQNNEDQDDGVAG